MPKAANFKIGDIVRLKSGGHPMMVSSVDGTSIICVWSVRGDIKSKAFSSVILEEGEAPISWGKLIESSMKKRADADNS